MKTPKPKAKEMPAGEFKAKCLKLMDQVKQDRREIVITKHGKPIVKLVPYEDEIPSLYGCMKGRAKILGDIISPIDVKWDVLDQ
jgi:prevent-host-death family protein